MGISGLNLGRLILGGGGVKRGNSDTALTGGNEVFVSKTRKNKSNIQKVVQDTVPVFWLYKYT
jgi:hypothetical protein